MSSKKSEALISALAGQADFAAAARTLTDPIRQAINAGGSEEALEEKLSSSWNIIIDVAARTQHEAQGPLVETMKAVQKQGVSNGERSDTVTIWGSQVKLWEDMPLFGTSVREAWNRGRCISLRQYRDHHAKILKLLAQVAKMISPQLSGII